MLVEEGPAGRQRDGRTMVAAHAVDGQADHAQRGRNRVHRAIMPDAAHRGRSAHQTGAPSGSVVGLGLQDLAAPVETGRADVVAQVHLAGGRLDRRARPMRAMNSLLCPLLRSVRVVELPGLEGGDGLVANQQVSGQVVARQRQGAQRLVGGHSRGLAGSRSAGTRRCSRAPRYPEGHMSPEDPRKLALEGVPTGPQQREAVTVQLEDPLRVVPPPEGFDLIKTIAQKQATRDSVHVQVQDELATNTNSYEWPNEQQGLDYGRKRVIFYINNFIQN